MKTRLLWLTLACALCASAQVNTVYVGLSPFHTQPDRDHIWNQLCLWLTNVPAGTRVVFDDAWALRRIVAVEIPRLRFDTPKARARYLNPPLVVLRNWLANHTSAGVQTLSDSAALRAPEYLTHVASQTGGQHYNVVLVGSPLYQNPSEPSFSFGTDRFPTDAHLACDQMTSVFGVAQKQRLLEGVCVLWWYPSEALWSSTVYKDYVERFWHLFIAHQSGALVAFAADPAAVLSRATISGLTPKRRDRLDPQMDRVEMLTIRRDVPWRVHTNKPTPIAWPTERVRTTVTNLVQALQTAVPSDNTAIGIAWGIPGLDLDLYVWATPDAEPLFFANTRTPEGRYIHDWQDANEHLGDDSFEYVVLDVPVNFHTLKAFVNFFAGDSPQPVSGKFIVKHAGRLYRGTFSLPARSGNRGRDLGQRHGSPHWTELKLADLVQSGGQAASR